MAEKKQNNELDLDQMGNVSGGWLIGPSDYSHEEYNKAGVTWQQNTWSKDEYFYKGQKITQDRAKEIVKAYRTLNQ